MVPGLVNEKDPARVGDVIFLSNHGRYPQGERVWDLTEKSGGEMATEAVLLVGHGSREVEGNDEFLLFAARTRAALAGVRTEACFIELAEPSIPEGLDRCVASGAQQVVVLPVILFAAGHVKVEIPHEIDKARQRHPGIAFHYGRPFGLHPFIFEILDERLGELEEGVPAADRKQTAVLLVGRGSSDPDATGDLHKIARVLWEGRDYGWVEACFIGITRPNFPEGIRRCVTLGARRILVLPYLLFTGVLIRRMRDRLRESQAQYPEITMGLARYLGPHPNLVQVLIERHEEALHGTALMNCEMCKYRVLLSGHEAAHHAAASVRAQSDLTLSLASGR